MGFLEKIKQDLDNALKAGRDVEVSTLRFVISKTDNARISKGSELSDDEVLSEIAKEAKRHKESIEAFRSAGREELAQKEEAELKVLSGYLPEEMAKEEIEKFVDEAIGEIGATSVADIGKVMSKVMEKVKGKADGGTVGAIVKGRLS